jgi:hypothetical protein
MKSELWAIVEVMGHSQYAGRVSEYAELGVPLVRVEIPATKRAPAFEKLLGQASIFRITPVSKEVAEQAAESFCVRPLELISLPSLEPARLTDAFRPEDEDEETGWTDEDEDEDE